MVKQAIYAKGSWLWLVEMLHDTLWLKFHFLIRTALKHIILKCDTLFDLFLYSIWTALFQCTAFEPFFHKNVFPYHQQIIVCVVCISDLLLTFLIPSSKASDLEQILLLFPCLTLLNVTTIMTEGEVCHVRKSQNGHCWPHCQLGACFFLATWNVLV